MTTDTECILVIDHRESDIIKILDERKSKYKVENLQVGDIVFRINEDDVFIIERKTKSDLAASIIDGRYKDQKIRITEHYTKRGIPTVYMIEDFYSKRKHERVPHQNLLAALVNTSLRDRIVVHHTNKLVDSVDYLLELQKKIPMFRSEEDQNTPSHYKDQAATSVQRKRSDNIDPDNILLLMLCQIPKVGATMAKVIAQEYKTIVELSSRFKEETTHPEWMLSDLKIGKRKIGKKISEQIYNFMNGLDPERECNREQPTE